MLAVLMMLPAPAGSMTAAACFTPKNTPRSSTPIVRSYSSALISAIEPVTPSAPALLNMTSRPPKLFVASAIAARTSSSRETSVWW